MKPWTLAWAVLAALAPLPALANPCDHQLTARALVAPWNAADQDFFNGRTTINYFFEMRPRRYRVVYGNEQGHIVPGAPTQSFRADPFYDHQKALGIQLIQATDRLISLDFRQVRRAKDADLVIVGYCDPNDRKEGAVAQNATGAQAIMILNGCRGIAT